MKFLLDENVSHKALGIISKLGFQVSSVKREKLLGIKNGDLSPVLNREDWVIITHDRGFRAHCFKYKLKVILIEVHPITEKYVLPVLVDFFKEFNENVTDNFLISLQMNSYTITNY